MKKLRYNLTKQECVKEEVQLSPISLAILKNKKKVYKGKVWERIEK